MENQFLHTDHADQEAIAPQNKSYPFGYGTFQHFTRKYISPWLCNML